MTSFEAILRHQLNPPQAEAACYVNGPLLVLAGAGSGKTRVITYRIAHLINDLGLAPWNVLAVTFTNKAAKEMRDRVANLLAGEPRGLWIGTFHALCSRILRMDGEKIGIQPTFTIYDRGDQISAVKRAMVACDISTKEIKANAALSAISSAKNRFEWASDYETNARSYHEIMVTRIYKKYQQILRENNALDFDDILMETVRLLLNHEETRLAYQTRFKHVLVDEYQDTNHPQYLFLSAIAKSHRNICAVGDDDQSIYRWRGADIRNILDFERDYPNARIVRLEQNYRSTRNIIEAATQLVKQNRGRHGKTLWTDKEPGAKIAIASFPDETAEAYWACQEIERLHKEDQVPYSEIALFYRINALSRSFEEECLKRGVPYVVVAGTAFYERREVKDALAYIRLLANPADSVSFQRIVNEPKRKLGKTSVANLMDYAAERGIEILRAAREVEQDAKSGLPPAARRSFAAFAKLFERWRRELQTLSLAELIERVLKESGYRALWEEDSDPQSDSRVENLAALAAAASLFEEEQRREADIPPKTEWLLQAFLENVTLISDQDALTESDEQVKMMTVHSAKGLEFPYVFLVGMEEMVFPHARSLDSKDAAALEEERRLCYVGVTRAMRKLYITYATTRRLYGDQVNYSLPSRFIEEIPDEYREDVHWSGGGDSIGLHTYGRPEPEDAGEALVEGDMVNHRTFGFGVVLEVDGEGAKSRVTVEFQDVGRKTLVQQYARLQKV